MNARELFQDVVSPNYVSSPEVQPISDYALISMNSVADYLASNSLATVGCHAKHFRTWQMRYVNNMILKNSNFVRIHSST